MAKSFTKLSKYTDCTFISYNHQWMQIIFTDVFFFINILTSTKSLEIKFGINKVWYNKVVQIITSDIMISRIPMRVWHVLSHDCDKAAAVSDAVKFPMIGDWDNSFTSTQSSTSASPVRKSWMDGTDLRVMPAMMMNIPVQLYHVSFCFRIGMERRAQNTTDDTRSIW